MGRAKVVDDDEQIANLQRRATELKAKANRRLVLDSMALYPYCINELVSKLESLEIVVTVNKRKEVVRDVKSPIQET